MPNLVEESFALLFTGGLNTDNRVDDVRIGPSILDDPKAFIESGRHMNERVRVFGCEMFPQLSFGLGRNMAGLKAPSELPVLGMPDVASPAMTRDEILTRIDEMVEAARIVQRAGFLGVDVHALRWGHLMDEFALALMNRRTDEFGGSLENRLRIPRLIVEGIKRACGEDFAVTIRLAVKSYIKGLDQASFDGSEEAGRTPAEAAKIAALLERYGYDAISLDSGTCDAMYWACPPSYVPKNYMEQMAAEVKRAVSIPVIVASRMPGPKECDDAIASGFYDGVVLGRASLADPDLPNKVLSGHPEQVRPCLGCNQGCFGGYATTGRVGCAVNPEVGLEGAPEPAATDKHVVVVGGGVAGMEAALTASARGAKVTLFEVSDHLGGNLIVAGTHDFKHEVLELSEWYESQLATSNVEVHLGETATAESLSALGVDAVILAVGSVPVMPRSIVGIDHSKSFSSLDAIAHEDELGWRVVVVGGGLVGCELALDLAAKGKRVSIVEALPALLSAGPAVPGMNAQYLFDAFEHYGVDVHTSTSLIEVNDEGALIEDASTHEREQLSADSVVLAIGFRPVASLAEVLRERGIEAIEVGDGRRVGNIMTAIHEARVAANAL